MAAQFQSYTFSATTYLWLSLSSQVVVSLNGFNRYVSCFVVTFVLTIMVHDWLETSMKKIIS